MEETMAFVRIELARDELRVIFFEVLRAGIFKDLVAIFHFDTQ